MKLITLGIVLIALASLEAVFGSGRSNKFEIEAHTGSRRITHSHLYGLLVDEKIQCSDLHNWAEANVDEFKPSWRYMHSKTHGILGVIADGGFGEPLRHTPLEMIDFWSANQTDEQKSVFIRIQMEGTDEQKKDAANAIFTYFVENS